MNDVIIVGFPKSGNTWLARLMGDALNRPIRGTVEAKPLAAEGEERGDARGIVRQLHLKPSNDVPPNYPGFVASPWAINPQYHTEEKIVHIIRDPRDVAIAIDAYWVMNDLNFAITEVMGHGETPLWGFSWEDYVTVWRTTSFPHIETRYEWLHDAPLTEMQHLLYLLELKPEHDLEEVVFRQSFDERKKQIDRDGENMPHGISPQRKNLRKGIVGDWKNVYTAEHKRLAFLTFGHMLISLGYESSPLWWCSTPERNEISLLEMLDALYQMTDTGIELCRTLYQMTERVEGDIVEVGAGRGRTSIALGWRSGNHIVSVDNYADNIDWARNHYGQQARADYISNTSKAGVKPHMVNEDAIAAGGMYSKSIGLWFWDVSSYGRLLGDWQAWRDKVQGRALIRDTFDYGLGSREVIEYEAGRGEFEIERDDPGILVLRRIG
jgi:hypothetical protein